MPTANRRAYVPRAPLLHRADLHAARAGDPRRWRRPGGRPRAGRPHVRYIRAAPRSRPLGAKRNACVEAARGDLIMHWDDDDWHAPTVSPAGRGAARGRCPGLRPAPDALLQPRRRPGLALHLSCWPASLARRRLAALYAPSGAAPFPAIGSGEDTPLIWGRLDRGALAVPDFTIYVATVHQGNTSRKRTVGPTGRPGTATPWP